MCVTSDLATSPADGEWQVLLILLGTSLTAVAHLIVPGDGSLREFEKESGLMLLSREATQQSINTPLTNRHAHTR